MKLSRRAKLPAADVYRRSDPVTIRWATPDDAPALAVLAQLDEAPVPPAPLLLALVGDELWVAASLGNGAAISDPFRRSAEVATLVAERGRQLTVPGPRRRRLPARRLRLREPAIDGRIRAQGQAR